MAKKKNMTLEEAIQVILKSGDDNPLRQMLEFMAQQTLEYEMTEHLGAEPYERAPERRGMRNGYKPRTLITRVGGLHLSVPQDREGTFSTSLFERYQRSEKALVLSLMEMYVQGVSTRKVKKITEELCGISFSSQLVSKLTKDLDQELEAWRNRPLCGPYPYLIVDARYEKVRINHKVVSQGVLIVVGINAEGRREILSVEVADTENSTTWSNLFRRLKQRGLAGVLLVISDDHEGIKAATSRFFQGACWQRCQCHFIRNLLCLAPKGLKKALHAELRAIFDASDFAMAKRRLEETIESWLKIRPDIAEKLDKEAEDVLTCFHFPASHRKRIRTTNCLERLNQEIRRRTRVVRIFPNRDSALRLITALCVEQSEEWETGRKYLNMEELEELKEETELQLKTAAI